MKFSYCSVAVLIFLAAGFIITVGCGGRKMPDGMPALRSCKLTFTQENVPLADATVFLRSVSPDFKWSVSGMTDDKGVVNVSTEGFYPGVPEGTYKVVVTKTVELENGYYSVIEKQYEDVKTTPLDLEITAKGNDKTFDLGKSVETFLRKKKSEKENGK